MRSEIEVHNIFGKSITHQLVDNAAWLVVSEGRSTWAYTNDKRKCLGIMKNGMPDIATSVNVESVSNHDMITLLNHFHCSVNNTKKFKENVFRLHNI